MARKYFGTDGIRGTVGTAPITPEFVLRLGQAAGLVLARQSPGRRATVLIGKDTRISGYMFEQSMAAGICSMGCCLVPCHHKTICSIHLRSTSMSLYGHRCQDLTAVLMGCLDYPISFPQRVI